MSRQQLVNRATMGFTRSELDLANVLGSRGYIDHHLDYLAIDDSALNAILAGGAYPTLTMTPQQLSQANSNDVINQLIRARIVRAALSKRQLFERMVEFWTDHFNIWNRESPMTYLKTADDRDVIRANALGTFGDLLRASAHSPAMLAYLNNDTNVAGNVNENYARELMELHTLGVNGGYTQQDVVEVARCFTGWTFWGASAGAAAYTFRYNSAKHDNGQKVVLGHVIPAGGGQSDGDTVLNILISHPSTATFISTKMLSWLWGPDPDPALVASLAQVYQTTGGNIKLMVRHCLGLVGAGTSAPKFKRPFDLMISGLRALSATVTTPSSLQTPLLTAGNLPFNWSPPDGYPDTLTFWAGLLLPRWSFGASLMQPALSGITVNLTTLLNGAVTAQQVADRIDYLMFNNTMPAAEKTRIINYMLPNNPSTTDIREGFALAIAAPGFQWY